MHARSLFVVAFALGCGSGNPGSADIDAPGGEGDDADVDMSGPGDDMGMQQANCDFTEAADATNFTTTAAEATNLTLATKLTLCAKIDSGHYDGANDLVDADGFKFTISADTDVMMHITGTGIAMPDDTLINLRQMNAFIAAGVVEGDHGTLIARLPAGEYIATMASFNPSATSAAIDYRLTIITDTPATRCPRSTAAGFTETADGGGNNGNDVISYESSSNVPSTLTAAADSPEATNITATSGTSYHVSGSSANVNPADDYEDRDTYAFTTGATTTQMTIRLNWASTTMDLDYRVYPVTTTGDPLSIVGGLKNASAEYELETFSVKPSTTYWLWIAAEDGATGQPSPYDATLCAETFAP